MTDFSATEIPKPLDWQAFQRACVPLFRAIIRDERLFEFGREGQSQHGIDLLGCRDGDPAHPVGIQCRLVEKPLTEAKIRSDAEEARAIEPPLRELIFATSAPRDQKLQVAAAKLSKDLLDSGWNCRVTVMAWADLQLEIITYPPALKAFWPTAYASNEPTVLRDAVETSVQPLAVKIDDQTALLQEILRKTTPVAIDEFEPDLPEEAKLESLATHTRIAAIRDLIKKGKAQTALDALKELLSKSDIQPYAKYRVLSNIGLIYFNSGENELALEYLSDALAMRPNDLKANVNLAFAELVAGKIDDARERVSKVLEKDPENRLAASLRIQSYSRDAEVLDPLSLVAAGVRHAPEVQVAQILFLRNHDNSDWKAVAQAAIAEHPNDRYLKRFAAEAKLETALADRDVMFGKSFSNISPVEIKQAADVLEELWREEMKAEIHRPEEIFALASNAAAAMRLIRDDDRAGKLLDATIEKIGRDPTVVRSRALLLLNQDLDDSALGLLEPETDPESMLLFAQIGAAKTPEKALQKIGEIDTQLLPEHLRSIPIEISGEIALARGDSDALRRAITSLRADKNSLVSALILEARGIQKGLVKEPDEHSDQADDEPTLAVRKIVADLQGLEKTISFGDRIQLAQFLDRNGAHEEASNLLHDRINLSQDSISFRTYLSASISAQLYARVKGAISKIPKSLLSDPVYARMIASYYWNSGDAKSAEPFIALLVERQPERLDLLLWHVDAFLRMEKGDKVRRLLKKPIENTLEGTLEDKKRLVAALNTYGENDRARNYAYRLFVLNRDEPDAWMAFMGAMLSGENSQRDELLSNVITSEHAFEVERAGEIRHYVIEDDKELRQVNPDALAPEHPIANAVRGLRSGDVFTWPTDGTTAKIKSAKHKLLDAFHDAIGQFNDRFPTATGFKQVSIGSEEKFDPSQIEGMLRKRKLYIAEQSSKYEANQISLSMLAFLTGVDTVDAMLGLADIGRPYNVAIGTEQERNYSFRSIRQNNRSGCVVDAPTYHCIRRLSLEAIVQEICGPIAISQVTLDIYNVRLQSLNVGGKALGNMTLKDDKLRVVEYPETLHDDTKKIVESDKHWLTQNAQVLPAQASVDPPAFLRQFSTVPGARFFDDIYAASGSSRLLLVDDLFTRQVAIQLSVPATNLQPVLMVARVTGKLSQVDYARSVTDLIEIGQTAIAIDAALLEAALEIDIETGAESPGKRVKLASSMLGGPASDPVSHTRVAAEFVFGRLRQKNPRSADYAAVSHVLMSVLRGQNDYRRNLDLLATHLRGDDVSSTYLRRWAKGHFLDWP